MSNLLQHHGMQHARLPCPLLSPRVCSNSCPLSRWCYLTISSSAALFSFCLQSFPASEFFPTIWLFGCVCEWSHFSVWPCDSMGCSPPGSSVHGILQARILQWVAMTFLTQGLSPCLLRLLHWQLGSLPVAPSGKLSSGYSRLWTLSGLFRHQVLRGLLFLPSPSVSAFHHRYYKETRLSPC